jgi:hypothetical protein
MDLTKCLRIVCDHGPDEIIVIDAIYPIEGWGRKDGRFANVPRSRVDEYARKIGSDRVIRSDLNGVYYLGRVFVNINN